MPKRVHVSYSPEDEALGVGFLMEALSAAGLELELRRDAITAAIVVVGPAALNSAAVVSDARDLLKRQEDKWFPIAPLLLDGISQAELRASGLHVLTHLHVSENGTFEERIAHTIEELDRTSPLAGTQSNEPHSYAAIRVIKAGGPGVSVTSVAFGEVDGKPVVVAGLDDSTVQILRLQDQSAPKMELRGHTGPVWSVALARADDRDVVVSGGDDDTVRVWNATTGSAVDKLGTHKGIVNSVAAGSGLLLSGGDDGNMVLWPLDKQVDPTSIATFPHPDFVNGVATLGQDSAASAVSGRVGGVIGESRFPLGVRPEGACTGLYQRLSAVRPAGSWAVENPPNLA